MVQIYIVIDFETIFLLEIKFLDFCHLTSFVKLLFPCFSVAYLLVFPSLDSQWCVYIYSVIEILFCKHSDTQAFTYDNSVVLQGV